MRIDKHLNLVVSVQRDESTIYVHSTPISREVFERFFIVISKAFAKVYNEGIGFNAGPRVAALLIKKVAMEMGVWDGPEGIQSGLMQEIYRLTNVITWSEKGWTTVPLSMAKDQGVFSEDEIAETEGTICFFILTSAMHKKSQKAAVFKVMNDLWDTQNTLLNSTEYAASLPKLTETDSSGVTPDPKVP